MIGVTVIYFLGSCQVNKKTAAISPEIGTFGTPGGRLRRQEKPDYHRSTNTNPCKRFQYPVSARLVYIQAMTTGKILISIMGWATDLLTPEDTLDTFAGLVSVCQGKVDLFASCNPSPVIENVEFSKGRLAMYLAEAEKCDYLSSYLYH